MTTLSKTPRMVIIDSLRGFALAGVVLVHITQQYYAIMPPKGFMMGVNTLPDQIIEGLIKILITGKFFALFSILFGLSFTIQMDSAKNNGKDFSMRFLWRAIILFVIGYVHHLFYTGDILTIYAMLVPLLIPFYKVQNKWILGVAAIMFLGMPRFISYAIFDTRSIFGMPAFLDQNNSYYLEYFKAIKSGSLLKVFQYHAINGMKSSLDFQLLYFGRFYYTFGYFLVGLWLGRIGLFRNLSTHLLNVKKALKWFSIILVVMVGLMVLLFSTAPQPVDFKKWHHVFGINFYDLSNLCFAAIILCAFILLYQKQRWYKCLSFFAPFGRMALTNYVFQSIFGTFIFYGWGLGYLGELPTSYQFFLGLVIITMQTLFSKFWLNNYIYGPLEWLWRCGTYMKWQPFKKQK